MTDLEDVRKELTQIAQSVAVLADQGRTHLALNKLLVAALIVLAGAEKIIQFIH